MQEPWLEKVEKIADEVCKREGCFLYELDFVGTGQGRTLRVFIDKEAGAGIDDCSNVSKGLNEILDAQEDLIPGGNYNLEVSTPGIDRVLKKPWHFEKVVGKKIWVKTDQPFETFGVSIPHMTKSKQMEAVLNAIENGTLVFKLKDGEVKLPLSHVEKSKVVFELDTKNKKRGS
jgi:ribosome maturation factor RimP